MARYEAAADYLAAMTKAHGLRAATRTCWMRRLRRGMREGKPPATRQPRLLAKIDAMR